VIPSDAGAPLERRLAASYGLGDVRLERLRVPVNDVVAVTASQGRFALKLYNTRTRTAAEVQWEDDLVRHLVRHGAPVVAPIAGRHGDVETFWMDGEQRVGVLFSWAPGEQPTPSRCTYLLLGGAAALIHAAADTFASPLPRDAYDYDARVLIDEQMERMHQPLVQSGRWPEMVGLAERLKQRIADPALDRGICHMDLTLSNVHRSGDTLTVFDFDSAGRCWRADEPYGVLRFCTSYFQDWLEGYRAVRPFGRADEAAVAAFGIIGDLRVVAWKLGVAASSRGAPLLMPADLPAVVDGWLRWEREHLTWRGRVGATGEQR